MVNGMASTEETIGNGFQIFIAVVDFNFVTFGGGEGPLKNVPSPTTQDVQ